MDFMMVLVSLFRDASKKMNIKIMKNRGKISEKIRTKWSGFIRRRTDLICWQNGLIRWRIKPFCRRIKPVPRRIKPVRRRIKPISLRIKPGHLVFLYVSFFLSSQKLAVSQRRGFYHQNQR